MVNRIQLRRGTAAEWAADNPVLADGEPGVERDTGKQKFGNGVAAWNALPYASKGDQGIPGVADDASVADLVTTPGSETEAALNATYAGAVSTPAWKANTAYAADALAVNPAGALVKANTAFTSAGTYNAANWTVVAPFAQLPRYYDEGGAYTDRGSIFTMSRNHDPVGFQPMIWANVAAKGDNTTFKGAVAGQFLARDRSDVDATNKGVLYALQAVVAPKVDRNNVPFDDVVGLSIVNQGTAIGTDALYFGNNRADRATNPGAKDFSNVIQNDMNSDSLLRSIATHDVGISFGAATFTTTAMRLGNSQTIAWNKGDGTLKHLLKLTSGNTFQLAPSAGGIDIRDAFGGIYTNAKLVMQNNTAVFGIRNGSTSEYEMVRITTSDNLALFAARATVLAGGGIVLQDVTTVPTAPTGGHVLYSEAGVLKSKGPSGTVTTIGAA